MNENIDLIQCGDHSYAPWHVICVHLMEGQSREWLTLNSNNPELDYDYLCPDCMELHEQGKDDLDKLRCACMHCVRDIRKQMGIPDDPPRDRSQDEGDD